MATVTEARTTCAPGRAGGSPARRVRWAELLSPLHCPALISCATAAGAPTSVRPSSSRRIPQGRYHGDRHWRHSSRCRRRTTLLHALRGAASRGAARHGTAPGHRGDQEKTHVQHPRTHRPIRAPRATRVWFHHRSHHTAIRRWYAIYLYFTSPPPRHHNLY